MIYYLLSKLLSYNLFIMQTIQSTLTTDHQPPNNTMAIQDKYKPSNIRKKVQNFFFFTLTYVNNCINIVLELGKVSKTSRERGRVLATFTIFRGPYYFWYMD